MAKVTFEIWDDEGEVSISSEFAPEIQEGKQLTPAQALAVEFLYAFRAYEKDLDAK